MTKVLVTGSADGLGRMVAAEIADLGHEVVLHARNEQRARDALRHVPEAAGVVVGDVASLDAIRKVAERAQELGPFDAVVHNVGIGYREPRRVETVDGLSQLWTVNVLAPYLLTALIERPKRLVYLSSGMHLSGRPDLRDAQWSQRRWDGVQAYSDSKLHDVLLAFAIGRHWADTRVNVVSPGWVPTRMGGSGAPDDLYQAHLTQVELAVGTSPVTQQSGGFYYHLQPGELHPQAGDPALQDALLDYCARLAGVALPT